MANVAVSGIPGNYPVAVNQPLDRAFLRPLQEPVYDTEGYNFASVPSSLTFFQRPYSQADASGIIASKDFSETNLTQSSMLDYPREHSILGFNIAIDSAIGLKAIAYLIRRAYFEFTFSGRRPYLRVPLNRIPAGQALDGAIAAGDTAGTYGASEVFSSFHVGMPHAANYYKFNLGRAALKIRPGEAFNAKIVWPTTTFWGTSGLGFVTNNDVYGNTAPAIVTSGTAGWLITTHIVGLSWVAL
jgi:hypothetical protein